MTDQTSPDGDARAVREGDIVTITPLAERLFQVIELDTLYDGAFIKVEPTHPEDDREPFWASTTYLKIYDA